MLTSTLLSLALVLVTAAAAWATADALVSRFWRVPHWALRTAILTCIGLLIWSHVIFGLALAHFATRTAFSRLLVVFGLLAATGLARSLVSARAKGIRSWAFWLLLGGAAVYFVWLTAAASLPPTSTDELAYHLEVPRRFLEVRGQPFFQDNIYAYYPQFGEMFFMLGLAFHLETAARLFHVLFILLLGLAVFGYSREYLDRFHSATAMVLFLSVPSVMVVGASAYVDVTFACFAFLAVVAVLRFLDTGTRSWLFLAAVMAGGACSVKYNGLQLVLLLLLLLLVQLLRSEERRKDWVAAALFVVVALLIASPYYLRNYILTGWPLFPFRLPLFALSPNVNWDPNRAGLLVKFLTDFGAASADSLIGRLLGPILVFIKGRFMDFRAYDGIVGPVFLLAPLLWLKVKGAPSQFRLLFLFSAFFLGYWTVTTQQVRFLFPVLPGLAILLAYGLKALGSRGLNALVWLFVAINTVVGVNQVFKLRPTAYWSGSEPRNEYVARHVNGYDVYQDVAQIVGPHGKVYMVCSFTLFYYFQAPVRADYLFEDYRFGRVLAASAQPGEVLRFLQSQGATHLLLNEGILIRNPLSALPLNDQKKLEQFLASSTTEVYQRRDFRLFRLVPEKPSDE